MPRSHRAVRTCYGLSPWVAEASRKPQIGTSRLRGAVTTSVVIIGGGLTGCAVAHACGVAGMDAVLIEADRIGNGGGARADGVARAEPAPSFAALQARVGRRAARAMFKLSRRAVLDLAAAVRRLPGRALKVESQDAIRIAPAHLPDPALQKEALARRGADIDARWLAAARAAVEARTETTGAMRVKGWASVDPHSLALRWASGAASRGVALVDKTPVRKIRQRRHGLEVHVEGGGIVTAETVVVCTGEPTDLFRPLKRHFRQSERYMVLTEPLPAPVRRQVFENLIVTDTETPMHLFRRAGDRLFVAGADQARTPARSKDKVLVQRTGQLMYELLRRYPAISGVRPSYGWDVPLAASADDVMVAGPHRNYPGHLFAWGTGHDPACAFLASRIVLRHLQGEATHDDRCFGFTRG